MGDNCDSTNSTHYIILQRFGKLPSPDTDIVYVVCFFLVHVLMSHIRSSGTLDDVAFEKIFPTKAVMSPNIMVSQDLAFCASFPTRMLGRSSLC